MPEKPQNIKLGHTGAGAGVEVNPSPSTVY